MILIADDDLSIRTSLKLLLERNGYETQTASTPDAAIETVRTRRPEVVVTDMNFSRSTTGEEGLTLLRRIKVLNPDLPVILITAWGSIPLAVEGMRAGAFDFISKPWDNKALLEKIHTAIALTNPAERAEKGHSDFDRSKIIGKDPALLSVLATAERVAKTDAPVLILGENGTGKELIAEAIHLNSRRAGAPMVKVNLGGISRTLFESEMFGYRKGAFTGAVADREGRFAAAEKGTIFLDEIGDLDPNSQVKLLRVLQEHTYEPLGDSRTRRADVRVVCATNADLPAMIADGTFREDLFYRINLITLTLPPLRQRPGDIPLLAEYLLAKSARACGLEVPQIAPEAMELLKAQPWPGNIRQLANILERTLLLKGGPRLEYADFIVQGLTADPTSTLSASALDIAAKAAIEGALARSAGNISKAAAVLGITRQTLYRRMAKLGISYQPPSL